MRTNTYSHLEALASSKRIVCERTGKHITLTTPDGGTTAECDSVAEALDTLSSDPTFAALPIVFAKPAPDIADHAWTLTDNNTNHEHTTTPHL